MLRKGSETFQNYIKDVLSAPYENGVDYPNKDQIVSKISLCLSECFSLLETSEHSSDKDISDMLLVVDQTNTILNSVQQELIKIVPTKKESAMRKFYTLMFLPFLMFFASCSSTPFKEQKERNDMLVKHMKQGKEYVGGEFDGRFKSSGSDGQSLRSVGIAVYPVNSNEELGRAKAVAAAKFRLIESAPTEFKSIVQQAIGNSLGYNGEFNQIQTSVLQVHGLQGIEVREEDIECRMVVEPTIDGSYNNNRECRAIARIPLVELKKAFDFTMEHKYGPQQKSSVQKILDEQLKDVTVTRKIANQ